MGGGPREREVGYAENLPAMSNGEEEVDGVAQENRGAAHIRAADDEHTAVLKCGCRGEGPLCLHLADPG